MDGPARAAVLDRVRFDASPEAALMRRYEATATTDLHRALNQFLKVRREGFEDESGEIPDASEALPTGVPASRDGVAPGLLSGQPNAASESAPTPAQDEPNETLEAKEHQHLPAIMPVAAILSSLLLIVVALFTAFGAPSPAVARRAIDTFGKHGEMGGCRQLRSLARNPQALQDEGVGRSSVEAIAILARDTRARTWRISP